MAQKNLQDPSMEWICGSRGLFEMGETEGGHLSSGSSMVADLGGRERVLNSRSR